MGNQWRPTHKGTQDKKGAVATPFVDTMVQLKKGQNQHKTDMPFKPGNHEWKKRKVCRGGRPTKEELAKRKIEKQEWGRAIRVYAKVRAARMMGRIFGIQEGACPLCERTA